MTQSNSNIETGVNLEDLQSEFKFDIDEFLKEQKESQNVETTDKQREPIYEASQELFLIPGVTRNVFYRYAHLSKANIITFFNLVPVRLHDPKLKPENRNRTVYLAHSLNSRKYTNNEGLQAWADSNKTMMRAFLTKTLRANPNDPNSRVYENPYNQIIMHAGSFQMGLIPHDINLTPEILKTINQPAALLEQKWKKLLDHNYQDPSIQASQAREIYKEYQNNIRELYDRQMLTLAHVLVANEASLKPHIGMDSYFKSENPFLNAEYWLNGNNDNEMTYMPVLNKVHGSFVTSDASEFPNSDIKLGKRPLGNTGLQETSKKAFATDRYNNKVEVVVRASDNPRTNNNSNKQRSDSLEAIAARNQTISVIGSLRLMVKNKGEQGKRNGINLMTVMIDNYNVTHNMNTNSSQEYSVADVLGNSEFEMGLGSDENLLNSAEYLMDEPTKSEPESKESGSKQKQKNQADKDDLV